MNIKKSFFVIFLFALCLTSCSNNLNSQEKAYSHIVRVDGIENFKSPEGYYELNAYILPSIDFIDMFEYVKADYHFREHYETKWDFVGYEKSIVIIEYDDIIYEKAKEFCLENMVLNETYTLVYNGFIFLENIKLSIEQNRENSTFPMDFNMFAYNDELKTLVFIGYYNPGYADEDVMPIIKNWGGFLADYFSDVYVFK